ncbi:sensor histidine kinase [Clostridium manihotivorum]|uniref:histidine kinase n=1 Tax=Clostridium manihotivorum TaxID=2320868 RepID=A0A3R5VAV8_9CLOT|nr:ATP-binding protein [Clostridium manihotivorum]QAA34123.1 two-component sensor histidine kinase [Clostridium manihotivorum]
MRNIRTHLFLIMILTVIFCIGVTGMIINISISSHFKSYMEESQKKREDRIVASFESIYSKDKKWTTVSGIELQHEAHMSNFCISLLDDKKNMIWGMDPKLITETLGFDNMVVSNHKGDYVSKNLPIRYNGSVVGYVNIGQYSDLLLTQDDVDFSKKINGSIVIAITISIVIGLAVSLVVGKQFSLPVRRIAEVSKKIANGDLDARASYETKITEIRELKETINDLADKLNYQDDLRRRLISDVSHEIRTPLNVLQNIIEAMIDGIYPINNETLELINSEVIRFGKLLNNMKSLTYIDERTDNVDNKPVDLDILIKNILEYYKGEIDSKNLMLQYENNLSDDDVVLGDEDMLKQVYINLISNAIKYNKTEGKLKVTLLETRGIIRSTIEDTGIGIKKSDVPFIFERFYRGDRSREVTEGTGVGLTISKKIVDLHKGSIKIESEDGKFTRVVIEFNKIIKV